MFDNFDFPQPATKRVGKIEIYPSFLKDVKFSKYSKKYRIGQELIDWGTIIAAGSIIFIYIPKIDTSIQMLITLIIAYSLFAAGEIIVRKTRKEILENAQSEIPDDDKVFVIIENDISQKIEVASRKEAEEILEIFINKNKEIEEIDTENDSFKQQL